MKVYLSLGSNIGDRQQTIIRAIEKLQSHPSLYEIEVSRMFLTEPYGLPQQRDFINCAVSLESEITARDLLQVIHEIEYSLGRKREIKWGARTIDIDILFFGQEVIQEPDLIIPHPQIHKRSFVLQSLSELCPELVHPVLHKTIKALWDNLTAEISR